MFPRRTTSSKLRHHRSAFDVVVTGYRHRCVYIIAIVHRCVVRFPCHRSCYQSDCGNVTALCFQVVLLSQCRRSRLAEATMQAPSTGPQKRKLRRPVVLMSTPCSPFWGLYPGGIIGNLIFGPRPLLISML